MEDMTQIDETNKIEQLELQVAVLTKALEDISNTLENDYKHVTCTGQKVGMPTLLNNPSEMKRRADTIKALLTSPSDRAKLILEITNSALEFSFYGYQAPDHRNYEHCISAWYRLEAAVKKLYAHLR